MQLSIESIMSKEELEQANSRTAEAEKLLEAARLQLMRYKSFYGVMLASMPSVRATESINTMATNGREIFYSPEFVAGMTDERKKAVFSRIDMFVKDPKANKNLKEMVDVFYRPKTAREVAFVLEHECDHVISDHMSRAKGYNHSLYNIAADHRINTNLVRAHSVRTAMGAAWFDVRKGDKNFKFDKSKEFGFMAWGYCDFRFEDMYTEQIYEILNKEQPPQKGGKGQSGEGEGDGDNQPGSDEKRGVDDHCNQDGSLEDESELNKAMGTDPKKIKPLTQEERNHNDSVMRRAIQNAVQAAGSEAPEDARKFVEESGKPKINYLRLLRRTIERLFKDNVSYRRLSRRSYSLTTTLRSSGHLTSRQTVGLPAYTKAKTIRANIWFDVSGSFTDELLAPTMREIRGLCNQYEDFEVELGCWSTEVGNVQKYTKSNLRDLKDYKITTTGGTDVRCVFDHMDKEKKEVDQIVIYTDGYFGDVSRVKDWKEKYGSKTLWVIIGRHGSDWTPPFGNAVDFDKYL